VTTVEGYGDDEQAVADISPAAATCLDPDPDPGAGLLPGIKFGEGQAVTVETFRNLGGCSQGILLGAPFLDRTFTQRRMRRISVLSSPSGCTPAAVRSILRCTSPNRSRTSGGSPVCAIIPARASLASSRECMNLMSPQSV
jgi:hypothetical protein